MYVLHIRLFTGILVFWGLSEPGASLNQLPTFSGSVA